MLLRPELRLDWATAKAAAHSVERWHYSGSLPTPPRVHVGVYEAERFVGVIIFSRGATQNLLKPYGLLNTEGCELTRIALRDHVWPVTRMVSIAVRMVTAENPGLRLIVSYSDPARGHHGGIYQGGNWIYSGVTPASREYISPDGKRWHERMISPTGHKKVYGRYRKVWRPDQCCEIMCPGKHRYLLPLDEEIRLRVAKLSRPYPKRAKQATEAHHVSGGGAAPTRALQI